MCLDKIDRKTRTDITHGYKVFKIIDGKIYGEIYNLDGTRRHIRHFDTWPPYEINKWYKAGDYTIKTDNISYPTGFHVFIDKEDAKTWRRAHFIGYKILKVEVNNIVISGFQYFNNKKRAVVVSKRMKIMKILKEI